MNTVNTIRVYTAEFRDALVISDAEGIRAFARLRINSGTPMRVEAVTDSDDERMVRLLESARVYRVHADGKLYYNNMVDDDTRTVVGFLSPMTVIVANDAPEPMQCDEYVLEEIARAIIPGDSDFERATVSIDEMLARMAAKFDEAMKAEGLVNIETMREEYLRAAREAMEKGAPLFTVKRIGEEDNSLLCRVAKSAGAPMIRQHVGETRFTAIDMMAITDSAILHGDGMAAEADVMMVGYIKAPIFVPTDDERLKARGLIGYWQFDDAILGESAGSSIHFIVAAGLRVAVTAKSSVVPAGRAAIPAEAYRQMTGDNPAQTMSGDEALTFTRDHLLHPSTVMRVVAAESAAVN